MADISDLFWKASLTEWKQGYVFREEVYTCLVCGKRFDDGVIYPNGELMLESRKAITAHIEAEHQSMFHYLLNLDKKLTGLTDHQKTILALFYEGASDGEVAAATSTGSTSTIRNHRFTLRERQKQAKVFLAIMELLGEQTPRRQNFIEIPRGSEQVDDRFAITEEENSQILTRYFKEGVDGRLDAYPLKEKKRVAILRHIMKNFEPDRRYSEKEVNAVIQRVFDDYMVIRRHLIEYGFMERTVDGSVYWVKP